MRCYNSRDMRTVRYTCQTAVSSRPDVIRIASKEISSDRLVTAPILPTAPEKIVTQVGMVHVKTTISNGDDHLLPLYRLTPEPLI